MDIIEILYSIQIKNLDLEQLKKRPKIFISIHVNYSAPSLTHSLSTRDTFQLYALHNAECLLLIVARTLALLLKTNICRGAHASRQHQNVNSGSFIYHLAGESSLQINPEKDPAHSSAPLLFWKQWYVFLDSLRSARKYSWQILGVQNNFLADQVHSISIENLFV